MFRKFAIAAAMMLPILSVAAAISSVSRMRSEFVGVHPMEIPKTSAVDEDLQYSMRNR